MSQPHGKDTVSPVARAISRERRSFKRGRRADDLARPSDEIVVAANNSTNVAAEASDLLDILIARRWLVLGIIAASVISGGLILSLMTPRYTATAQVMIESRGQALPSLEAIVPGLGVDMESIVTETAVLRSRTLLSAVVEQLDLTRDPEFNNSLQPPGPIGRFAKRLTRAIGFIKDEASLAADSVHTLTVDALSSELNVAIVPDSRVISIQFTSESPRKSSQIVNVLVDEYLSAQQLAKMQASAQTSSWLEQKIAELQAQLLESEQKVEDFRSKADLLEAAGATLTSQQMADLSGQLIAARAASAAATARLTQLNEITGTTDSHGIYASSEVLQSRLVQTLREQQVIIERRIAELSSEFGPAHPTMVQLRAEADDLKNQISLEVDKIAQGLRNEVAIARAREAAIESQVAGLTSRLSKTNENEIQLRSLEREADANRQLLETLLARQKELGSPDEMPTYQSDARVISYADQPISPSFPDIKLSMVAIFVASSLFAFVVAFVVEIRRRGFVDMEQLEAATRLTTLGFLPLIKSRRQRIGFLDSVLTDPRLPFAQAVKAVNWQFSDLAPGTCTSILITSAIIDEGKTSTAISMARLRAAGGQKTLLVDGDIRKPSIHEYLDLAEGAGLREVLESGHPVDDLIQADKLSSLDILPAGKASADALSWIDSPRMQAILGQLSAKYEFIVIDSPPVTAAPDAIALSKLADTTVLTVRWLKTPASALAYALRLLRRNGGHITGTILTMVDATRASNYSSGYYGAYGADSG